LNRPDPPRAFVWEGKEDAQVAARNEREEIFLFESAVTH
jgi:hypothetical protein